MTITDLHKPLAGVLHAGGALVCRKRTSAAAEHKPANEAGKDEQEAWISTRIEAVLVAVSAQALLMIHLVLSSEVGLRWRGRPQTEQFARVGPSGAGK